LDAAAALAGASLHARDTALVSPDEALAGSPPTREGAQKDRSAR
jgi:hypothetical protein